MKKRYTDDERALIKRAVVKNLNDGWSIYVSSSKAGVDYTTIKKWAKTDLGFGSLIEKRGCCENSNRS